MLKNSFISIREINKKNILRIIIDKGSISRIDISKLLKISRPTISAYVSDLLEENLIEEFGKNNSTSLGGKKAVRLNFNYNAGYIISVSIGVNKLKVAITNLKAEIISILECDTEQEKGPETVIKKVVRLISKILTNNKDKKSKIIGIGISATGLVDSKNGIVIFSPNLSGWNNISLKEIIEEKTNFPTFIENECRISAIAEKKYGLAKDVDNFVCFLAGIGIGTGVFINNKLVVGEKGLAGELGHLITDLGSNKQCHCGSIGCLEAISSTETLLSDIRSKMNSIVGKKPYIKNNLCLNDLYELYENEDKIVTKYVNENARLIGIGISNAIKIFNPNLVIIHGIPINFGEKYLNIVKETVLKTTFPKVSNFFNIKFSELGNEVKSIGAAGYVFDNIFKLDDLNLANEYIVKKIF